MRMEAETADEASGANSGSNSRALNRTSHGSILPHDAFFHSKSLLDVSPQIFVRYIVSYIWETIITNSQNKTALTSTNGSTNNTTDIPAKCKAQPA